MESPSPRLDGWKAIAAYLGRDERTAQRWRQRGLPVHLVPGGKRGTVFALTHEIDTWLTHHGPGNGEPDAGDTTPGEQAMHAPELAEPTPEIPHAPPSGRHAVAWRWWVMGTAALSVAALAAVVWSARTTEPPGMAIARAEVTQNGNLVAWRVNGQVAFSVPKSDLMPTDLDTPVAPIITSYVQPLVDDLDDDGSPDVIAVLAFQNGPRLVSDEIRAYSGRGTLLFQRRLQRYLRFGDREFDGPWGVHDRLLVRKADGRSRIVLAVAHDIWWPSFIVSLDANGTEQLLLVHSGHLYDLLHLPASPSHRLLATGVNNEYASAVLVALDPEGPPTVSPQSKPVYTCDGCEGGPPDTYILLPQTEVSRASGRSYNMGDGLGITPTGLHVSAVEISDPAVRTTYRLSPALDANAFWMSDSHATVHRQFEQKGLVDHAVEACPDRASRELRVWSDSGWRTVVVHGDSSPASAQ